MMMYYFIEMCNHVKGLIERLINIFSMTAINRVIRYLLNAYAETSINAYKKTQQKYDINI